MQQERGARTTNSVEGWHYGLQAFFSGSTPNISLLLRNLEKNLKMQKFKMPPFRDFWYVFFLFFGKYCFLSSE